jgi:hypothetical protein
MKIHGTLCHITFVHQDGRSHLPAFSSFIADFNDNRFAKRWPPPAVYTELRWWLKKLSKPGLARSLISHGPVVDLNLFVDASTSWGICISANGRWDAWRLRGNWRSKTRHIGWLEGVALEFLIYAIEQEKWHDVHLRVHSDNMGVISAFDKGRSRNADVNLSICRSALVLATHNITLDLTYI